MRLIPVTIWFTISIISASAQDLVTETMTVEEAIAAIESEHRVRFAYSKEMLPYEERVSLDLTESSLPQVLESLSHQTGMEYRLKGRRVALRYDASMQESLEMLVQNEAAAASPEEAVDNKLSGSSALQVVEGESTKMNEGSEVVMVSEAAIAPKISYETPQTLLASRSPFDPVAMLEDLERKDPRVQRVKTEEEILATETTQLVEEEVHLAQFSFVPLPGGLQNTKKARTYRFSFNALAGSAGSVKGLEIGALYNSLDKDLEGVQVSGMFNRVLGDVHGGQIAGWSNRTRGVARGVQVAGVSNRSDQADAVQFAGLYNYNREVSRGFQTAGLFNISRNISGAQIAGLFNFSSGRVNAQAAGLSNFGDQVDAQIGGLFNIAREVKYVQIGLINIADTVGGASFGLLNLIRRGYNKVEFSVSEALFANVAIKLGTRKFYNIFQVSTNFKKNIVGNGLIWGYGYGLGFFVKLDQEVKINPELIVSNIHERNLLRPDLNLLNQFKLLFHFGSGTGKTEFFAGPTANLSISAVKTFDSVVIGTNIASYTIWESSYISTYNSVNTKFWIGFSAGIRL